MHEQMSGVGIYESESSEVALEQKNHRGNNRRHEKARHNGQTTREGDRAIMDFSLTRIVHQSDTKAHFLPQRQCAERQREAAHNSEQIDVEGEHGPLRRLNRFKQVERVEWVEWVE